MITYIVIFINSFSLTTLSLMDRLALIEKLGKKGYQPIGTDSENTDSNDNNYRFVDEILDRGLFKKQPIVLTINLDAQQKNELIKHIKDNRTKVCLHIIDDKSNNSKGSIPANSIVREAELNRTNKDSLLLNNLNIILKINTVKPLKRCEKILTNREEDIMKLLSQGLLYKEIAKNRDISVQTVKSHLKHIYTKLQVCNRTEAILKYFKAQ